MIIDLFSKRRKRERGEVPDVYTYDVLPQAFRVQVVHIIRDGLEAEGGPDREAADAYRFLHDTLAREYGLFTLDDSANYDHHAKALTNFFLAVNDVERALDVVELSFRYIAYVVPDWQYAAERRATHDHAIEELNYRFRENSLGYQFESGEIIRVDSQIIHEGAVKPALMLLSQPYLHAANEEFLKAHEHYRHGRYKEAVNEALKAFESTMKSICAQKGWAYAPNATAVKLLDVCFENGLIPAPLQSHFSGLRATLEAGIPTIRNKNSGHGQGSSVLVVPEHLVAYALNITASGIRLLAEAAG